MLEAIRQAMRDELAADDKVVLIGQDIAEFGGAFKVTQGLVDEFGSERVVDTPISESAMIGAAIGAAMVGLKPVVEMQFIDFLACGYNQLVNFAGKMRYRWGQGASLVVRGPCGAGVSGSAFHSQSPESSYLCVPGIKVIYPSTAEDAYGLLRSAIQDPDPVLFLEHKFLYRRIKGEIGSKPIPLGQAATRRRGHGLTVVTYGAAVHTALEVAEQFGDQVEVLDLRCLLPLDEAAVFESVRRTNKVVLYHEAQKTLGMGAELSARISESLFEYLDGPVTRVAAPDSPIPFSPNLEKAWLPGSEQLAQACRQLLNY
ncbi:alpha-ketoacid dehydrogenase subunit beta [bacterium]|nr:alpha-ketoacid dehydrogenase subunit beta [bacterium]